MTEPQSTTDELIRRAAEADPDATEQLLDRFRDRLLRMVACRLDPRLKARLDPSDVVQDVLAEALKRLPEYLAEKPISFYPWLRRLAWERIVHNYRTHVVAERRSVNNEQRFAPPLTDQSSMMLANQLVAGQSNPSQQAQRNEMKNKVKNALGILRPRDRELLVLKYLEQLSLREIAKVFDIGESAVKSSHVRALKRLGKLIDQSTSQSW